MLITNPVSHARAVVRHHHAHPIWYVDERVLRFL